MSSPYKFTTHSPSNILQLSKLFSKPCPLLSSLLLLITTFILCLASQNYTYTAWSVLCVSKHTQIMLEADTTTEQENYCFIKDICVLQTYCGFYNDASIRIHLFLSLLLFQLSLQFGTSLSITLINIFQDVQDL